MEQLIVEESITGILHNIAARISANYNQMTGNGLFTGKMGVAIFLFHYGECYNNAACTQLAEEIIEDLRLNINEITSVDYANGLSGIDAGLKYLFQHGFINAAMAEMPEMAERTIYNSLINFPQDRMHERLYSLSGLGKYFAQDYRKRSLTGTGPFSNANRKGISRIIELLSLLDVNFIPQLHAKDVLRMADVFSRIINTGYMRKEIHQFFSHSLQGLEVIIFGNKNFKPFTDDCNPFSMTLALLQIYERSTKPEFATLAIRVLEKYEGAVKEFYLVNDMQDLSLLQHVIICKKLSIILKDDCFNTYAEDCLEFYKNRIRREQSDLSLQNGYAGEGLALLTLDGGVPMDWLEDLM